MWKLQNSIRLKYQIGLHLWITWMMTVVVVEAKGMDIV